ITLARAQKSPRRDLSSTKLPGSQTRCVVTRAPWELTLCVEVVSALQLRLRLASSTGSAKIVRASLRMPPLVPAFTSLGWNTWYLPHPHYRLESCSVNPVFTLNCRPETHLRPFRHVSRPLANHRRNLYATGSEKTKTPSMPDLSPELLAFGFIWYIAFLFSTTCHEAAHALVAKIGGDTTAASGGQVTLNPVPHIQREPWGMVVIPLISFAISKGQSMFGWASAPYDPLWERRHPHRAALMALAGPATNYLLMFLAVIGLRVGAAMHWLGRDPNTGRADFPTVILFVFFTLNLLLGTFNLLPAPPLDGSSVIMLYMSENRAHRYLDWLRGNNFAVLGLIAALLVFRQFYPYVEDFAVNVLIRGQF